MSLLWCLTWLLKIMSACGSARADYTFLVPSLLDYNPIPFYMSLLISNLAAFRPFYVPYRFTYMYKNIQPQKAKDS